MKHFSFEIRVLISAFAFIVLLSPVTLQAQTATPTPTTQTIDEAQLGSADSAAEIPANSLESLNAYVESRNACLEDYQLGSVLFVFDETSDSRIVSAGQSISFSGKLQNTNDYPMPQGKIFVRVLREDPTVADQNWHPIVAEYILPEEFNIRAQGEVPFNFTWTAPEAVPEGEYRVEFNFLGAGRYSLTGLTFVPNFTGGNIPFYVQNSSTADYLNFERDTVRLNNAPYSLRSVPPEFQPDTPFIASATLTNENSSQPVTTKVTTQLFEWSDTDGEPPVVENTQEITLAAGQSQVITFNWDKTLPGVYELVMKAEPTNESTVPSTLRVRFPVQGNTPRIMFSGITGIENGEATITTCVVNGTVGSGGGSVTTTANLDGQTLGSSTGNLETGSLSTTVATIPLANTSGTLLIATEAKNEQGVITDSHQTGYALGELLGTQATEDDEVTAVDTTLNRTTTTWLVIAIISIVVLILVATIVGLVRKRRPPTFLPPDSNQPL